MPLTLTSEDYIKLIQTMTNKYVSPLLRKLDIFKLTSVKIQLKSTNLLDSMNALSTHHGTNIRYR